MQYDETLFDEVKIEGVNDWHFEQNQDKSHEMYGKFVIYTMKEGITENQNVAELTLKLKGDLKPQTTEVKFTKLQSSDGEVSVDEDDRKAVIEIYEEPQTPTTPEKTEEPPVNPEVPETPLTPDKPETPEEPSKPEAQKNNIAFSVKTGDAIMVICIILALATIALNIMVILKNKEQKQSGKGIKIGIISAISIIAVGLLILGVTSFAHNSEITELINKLNYKEQWLNSEKYLVTDENVSRIAPLTNIQDITNKFNKEIEVYKQNSNEKVSDGLVKSGMTISDKEYSYDVSVLGDINGDGESNHIELTKIIRNIVDAKKYKFSNLEKLSADMNIDKTIDQGDVNVSVRYILYGELDIPGFDKVKEPKIEVAGGTFNDKIDAYENTMQIKITEQDENATKTKYKIEGTTTKKYTEIESGDVIELPDNGVYKISAYSYGKLGNRSEIPYEILVKKNPNNKYKIITRTEKEDGTYEESTEERIDRIGKTVTIDKDIPDGYEINEEQSTLTGEIPEDEIIELIVTYDRKEYTLTLESGDYISSVKVGDESNTTISKKFKFGKSINISAEIANIDGYTTTFDRWKSSNKDLIADNADKDALVKMPKADITLTAMANRVSNKDTKYTIEYYYQKDGIYKNTADSSKQKNGETGTDVAVDDTDKTPTKEGYVFDDTKLENLRGTINGNGTLVLKVYFKQQFTVAYKPGTKGTFEEQVTKNIDYGTETPQFNGELTHQEGYEFNGWDKTPADRVTENLEYIATWKEKEYNILYNLNGGSLGTDEDGNEIKNPDKYTIATESFTLKNPTKEGYEFKGWTGTDLNAESKNVTIEKGSTGDRSYTANWVAIDYTITYELNGGDLGNDDDGNKITNPTSYNVETPTFSLNNPSKIGYTFTGWTGTELSEETALVIIEKGSTGNRAYEANWRANTNVEYHVQYYLEKLDSEDSSNKNNYELRIDETHFGVTDEEVTAEIKEFTGFTYDENNINNIITENVAGNGTLVLKVYYTRNSYTLRLEKDDNVNNVEGHSVEKNLGISINETTGEATFKYQQPIEINATLKTEEGYDITFIKWESKNTDLLEDKFSKQANFEMPAGNITLKATSNKTAKTVDYTIEYYYQVNGTYKDTADKSITRRAETDTPVFVTEHDKEPDSERPGYTFDETKNGDLSGSVKGNGKLVLKVYFKQQFVVTYKSGDHGTFKYEGEEEQTEEKYENLDYNSTTPSLTGTLTAQKGYEFVNWNKEIADKVTENAEYTANWRATEYTITYNLNGGDLGLDNNGVAITNPTSYNAETEDFTLNNPTRIGYKFKGWTGTDLTETNESGEIVDKLTEHVTITKGSTGNRSYTANWEAIEYTINYNLDGGSLLEGATNPEKYTVETNTFTLNNPVKTGYTFTGWTGTELTETNESGEIVDKLTEQVTIEKGSTGNREYTANWQANTGVTYHVKYYLEKLESTDSNNKENYNLEQDVELSGTTNEEVTAEIKEYVGFTYDEDNPNNVITDNIAGDGKLVLEVYYTRNSYTLTLQKDDNIDRAEGKSVEKNLGISIDETTGKATFKYQQPIEIKATLKTIEGYTVTFKAWESSSTQVLNTEEEKVKKQVTFTMPAEDVTAKATSNVEANTVEYTVEYYYEGDDGYSEAPTYTNTRTAKIGESIAVTDADKQPDSRKPGYKFDESAENVLNTTIPTSGSVVLKVYFKKAIYTLNIVAGDGITAIQLGEETAGASGTLTGTYKYGESITIDASYGEETGYTIEFGKWKSNNVQLMEDNTTKNLTFTMPDGDLTLTAVANKIPLDTSYRVEFYYQKGGQYPEVPENDDIVTRAGKTGQQVSVTSADKMPIKEGYIFDNNAEGNVESTGEEGIAADGSTTLKIYFKQQFTVTYNPGEHGSFEAKIIGKNDYGANIPEYTGNLNGNNGYVFDTWKLTRIGGIEVTEETELPTIVTANLEYTAQWKPMPIPAITHIPTEWTNQNVTVTITAPEPGYSIEYRIDDNTDWIEYTDEFIVEQNCIIHARLAKETNKGEEVDHEIGNIDKINPQFAEKTINTERNDEAIITVKATDNLSGIVEYGITKEGYAGPQKYTCERAIDKELIFNEIYENGTYTMYLKDAAGNTSEDTIEITNITGFNVARIVAAPAGYEHLIGTEYETLALALETSDEAALAGNVKIEIIHNIFNETNRVQSGRDYTINLNNYYVKNQEAKTTLTVDGKLHVVDENKLGNGTISSPFGLGIYISQSGELTLGEDEGGSPSIFSPIIEGLTYGIQKEIDYDAEKVYDELTEKYYYPEGVFNFYDGKIIGGTAAFLLQRANDTPAMYDPTVITNAETKKQESTLAIVSGIEAVIGKKRYMLLEDAIEDANNVIGDSNTQVEITIVRDLAKDAEHKVVVDNTKNIKLDLNGHVFTTTANDYVLENYGKLEIYDSEAPVDYLYSINAINANIVTGSISGTTVKSTKDVNFEFSIEEEAIYEFNIQGAYMNRNCGVILDGVEVYNLINCTSTSEATIQLGNLSAGKHTIRLYSGENYGPDYNSFTIRPNKKASGKITGSTNSTILNGISSKTTKEVVYEDIDLTQATAAGDYFFESRAEGGLISNNAGIADTARSYIEVDLTGKQGMYEVIVNSTISSRKSYDYGYITVRNNTISPDYSDANGRKVYETGLGEETEHKFNLAGGERYYIHFGYRKASTSSSYNDCFIIKDMKIGKIESAGELTITSGIYECTKAGTNSVSKYLSVITNESILHVNGGTIKSTQNYTTGIYNAKTSGTGYVEINGGNINTYYHNVFNVSSGLVKANKGDFNSSNGTCLLNQAYLYVLGKDVNTSGYNSIYNSEAGVAVVENGTFKSKISNANKNKDYDNIIIKGGTISSSSDAIYNESTGKIKVENVTITSADNGARNHGSGVIEINNIKMDSVDSSGVPTVTTGLHNDDYSNGTIVFNNGDIHVKNHAGNNERSGIIEINGGTLKTYSKDYSTIINSNYRDWCEGTIKVTGGTITGPANAIYNLYKGKVIITGGYLETTSAATAIYNNNIDGKVTIGSKDEDVSTEIPMIKSAGSSAVNNKLGTFNFYDGVLIGKENNVIYGVLTDIPEQSELVKEIKEDGLQYVTLGIPTYYMAKISASENPDVSMLDEAYYKLEDGYYYFVTLNSAVQACSKTNASTIELIDDPWVYRTITIDESQDITIKFNDKAMYLHAQLNFENNGSLKFINENVESVSGEERKYGNINANGGLLIKNNENAEMNLDSISISYISSRGSSSNYRKLIDNYGILNIENSKYYVYTSERYSMYAYDIYNEETGILNIDNTNISGKVEYPILNIGKDKVDGENTIYSAIVKNSTITYTESQNGVFNDGEGTMLIENSTISSYSQSRNNSSGNMIIRNSTISSNNPIYNNSTGYIEIDNSIIKCQTRNESTGKILIKGADSKLRLIVNNNVDGIVEMQAGKVSHDSDAITNYGKLIISGGEVTGQHNTSTSGIRNNANGVVTITGEQTKITGSGYGIYNEGTATVESGIIKGNGNSGIYSKNKLTLGIKDGNVNYNPIVYGKTNGVYNTGTFNFYDGILEGNETASITGKIPSETEEECIRVIHKGECTFNDGTEDGYNVVSGKEISVLERVNIAYVVSKDKYYSSLQAALADTEDTDTIKIVHDASINGTVPSLDIQEGKNITLDLNSHNIVAGNNKTIVNNGTLRIIDSTSHEDEEGNIIEGTFVNGGNTILENNGTATIENGSYELTIGGNSSNYYSMFTNTGTLAINSKGTFKTKGTYSRVIYNTTGDVLVKDGILEATQSNSSAIWNNTGVVTIENGTIKGSEHSVYNHENGEINIINGTIENNVYNKSEGTINISGGNINSYVYNAGTGTINISGGIVNYSSQDRAVDNNSSGTINITGGSIKGSNTAILNGSTGTINIDGTSLSEENPIEIIGKYTNSYDSHGIRNASTGTINIKGYVNISASTGSSRAAYGIYNSDKGIVNVGDSENITNNIKINATNYGICNFDNQWRNANNSPINYYGGTITAPEAVYGYITTVPDSYDIIRTINASNYEVYEIGNINAVASVEGNNYASLEEAIESNTSGTVVLLKDIVLPKTKELTITENQNMVLDLNGHTIKLHNYSTSIYNYGTLKITDNSDLKSGKIYGYARTAIRNEGIFEMAEGTITIDQMYGDKVIHNTENGQVIVSGGTLCTRSHNEDMRVYIIYSDNANTITVTGGVFDFYGVHYYSWRDQYIYGIYTTNSNAIVNISGGTFNSAKKSPKAASYEYAPPTYAVCMSGGTANLSGNMISNNQYGIYMNKSGIVNINDEANLNNYNYSIYMNGTEGEININGGTTKKIRGTSSTTATLTGGNVIGTISSCGTIDVYEGVNFNVSGNAISDCTNVNIHEGAIVTATENAIYSYNRSEVNINNGTINGSIEMHSGILNMASGSITGKNYGIRLENGYSQTVTSNITGGTITATSGPGILISSGTLVLGEDDGGYPSTEIPAITGSTYGVKNDGGTFNFYDGILTGKTHATSGTVTKTPEMFKVRYSADGTVGILGIEATFEQVATVNGVFYDDLSSAIDAAIKVNGKVELCKDITTSKEITIPAGSTVTIDLLGFSINGYTLSGVLFTNNGTLIIDDSTNEGTNESTIRNYTGKVVVNNGTLTIGTNDDIVYTNAPKIIGKTIAIENNGDFYFVDGQIGASDEGGDVINNTGTGYKPEGYSISKLEGTNIYTLVKE